MSGKRVWFIVMCLLCSSFVAAKEKGGYFQVGYGAVKIGPRFIDSVVVDFGGRFGRTYKQSIGFRIFFSGENDNWSDGEGNIGEVYYMLGYEFLHYTTLSAKVGYAFEDIGSIHKTTAYATGWTYGVAARYALSEMLEVVLGYTHSRLRFESLVHDFDAADLGISYTF